MACSLSSARCEVLRGDLEPAHDPVVADPQHREAERPDVALGAVDAARASPGRRPCRTGSVTPGRASRASPRSGGRARGRCSRTCAFVTSCSGWTTPCSAAAFRPGRQSPASSALAPGAARCTRGCAPVREHVVELGLAEVAAVAAVRAVAGPRELVGADDLVRDPDVRGDAPRAVELAGGDRRARPRSPRARGRRARGARARRRRTSRRRRRTRRRRCRARRCALRARRSRAPRGVWRTSVQ